MKLSLPILALLVALPAQAGAPVERDGTLSPCKGGEASASQSASPWCIEIASSFSKQEALEAFDRAKQAYADLLGDFAPVLVEQCDLSLGTDIRYSAQIGFDSQDAAGQLCAKLQKAGGACIVQKN